MCQCYNTIILFFYYIYIKKAKYHNAFVYQLSMKLTKHTYINLLSMSIQRRRNRRRRRKKQEEIDDSTKENINILHLE